MEHVVVGSSSDLGENQIEASIINNRIAGNGLVSLIDGLKGENIGLESMGRTANRIAKYRQHISRPAGANLYNDSGGYSFIKGDLAPHKLDLALDLHQEFFELESDIYDFIFSLDIPYSLKFEWFNTKKNIYDYNKKSLEKSILILSENPKLAEKFFFIEHFKTENHYIIWKRLKDELKVGRYVKCRAIGGMVSIKEIAKLSIAQFIATTYQCLSDYHNSVFNGEDFRIHFLGISVDYDRFMIAFLERLIQRYIGRSAKVIFTYDTIRFKRSAMNRQNHIYDFNGTNLVAYNPIEIPESLYTRIYDGQAGIIGQTREDIERKASGFKHKNQANIAPLIISSELSKDRFFEHVIDHYHMVDHMMDETNLVHIKLCTHKALREALHTNVDIFGSKMIDSIMKSLVQVYHFHKWYTEKKGLEELDRLSRKFINHEINFPFKLS